MKKPSIRTLILVLYAVLIGLVSISARTSISLPKQASVRGDDVDADMSKAQELIRKSFVTGDSTFFLQAYAPDACIMPPNAPAVCGRQGVLQFFKNAYHVAGARDASFNPIALFGQTSDYVTQQGAFMLYNVDHQLLIRGKVLIVWKKTSDGWKMYRQSINFDSPMPGPGGSASRGTTPGQGGSASGGTTPGR
jgi:ketosteroid isomerase-like protein